MTPYRRAAARPPEEETPEEWWVRICRDRREALVSHIAGLAFVAAIAGELLMLSR